MEVEAVTESQTTSAAPAPAPAKKVASKRPAATKAKAAPGTAAKPAATKVVKPVVAAKAATAAKEGASAKSAEKTKSKKIKMVRDSLSIPKEEYEVIAVLKIRAGKLGHAAKKTEVIRAGIKAVAAMSDQALIKALQSVPSIKTGRPAKAK